MATPDPIGPLYYDTPRSVSIREPGNVSNKMPAVHSGVSIVVESNTEAQMLMDVWEEIMRVASDMAQAHLDAMRGV